MQLIMKCFYALISTSICEWRVIPSLDAHTHCYIYKYPSYAYTCGCKYLIWHMWQIK